MAICEGCGKPVELISFDELCADCEHLRNIRMSGNFEDKMRKLIYTIEFAESFPEEERKLTRNCDECVFAKMSPDELELFCLKLHKPRFYKPKNGDYTSGNWGWRRRCEDFRYKKDIENEKLKQLKEE